VSKFDLVSSFRSLRFSRFRGFSRRGESWIDEQETRLHTELDGLRLLMKIEAYLPLSAISGNAGLE
jgi:hypothetical protein